MRSLSTVDALGAGLIGVISAVVLVLAAAIGVFAFTGRPGWPAWYPLLWIPGALLVIRPAATWATLTALALSAGAGAAVTGACSGALETGGVAGTCASAA